MIRLTRLNSQPFVLNAELLQMIEETPDTVVTLISREKLIVQESADVIIRRVIDYHRTIRTFRAD